MQTHTPRPLEVRRTHAHLAIALLLLLGLPPEAHAQDPEPVGPETEYTRIATRFARQFPREHLTGLALDDTIAAQSWTNYLSSLDYERVYFMGSDIERFAAHKLEIENDLEQGVLDFAQDVFATLKLRVRDRCLFVAELLKQPFDLSRDETYSWKRDDAAWPQDDAERDELWRKKIKNEYVRHRVAQQLTDTEGPEADGKAPPSPEERILKRYEQYLTVLEDGGPEWAMEKYLSAFAHAYDPHSEYMSASSLEDFNIEMGLSLVGIGALLRAEDGAAKIVRLIAGGPADRDERETKLGPGDKIIAVGQGDQPPVDVLHWPLYRTVRLIRGERGTTVVLTVIPASDPSGSEIKTVNLVRDEVKLEEQAARLEVREHGQDEHAARKLGVVTLPAFYANMKVVRESSPEFRSASYDVEQLLEQANEAGVEGIVLDLRNNGGGALIEAVRMVGLFISTGPTVQVKETLGVRRLHDRDPSVAFAGPLVVLVNGLSASASEIVAAALQDYGRAVTVGAAHTHGKGTVQAIRALGRDSRLGAIKVTSSMFYRITGDSTQLKGVTPDIVLPSPYDYMELGESQLPNPLAWSTVRPAGFLPLNDLTPVLATLRQKSEARRAADPRFQAQIQLLKRIQAVSRTEQLPLNLEARRDLARTETELSRLEDGLAADEGEPTATDTDKPDLVLLEALNILSDLATLIEDDHSAVALPTPAVGRSWGDLIGEWLRSLSL